VAGVTGQGARIERRPPGGRCLQSPRHLAWRGGIYYPGIA